MGNRLEPLIVCDGEGIRTDEYRDILYDGLFSQLIADILQSPDDDIIQIMDGNTFIFMHDNALCHEVKEVLDFLAQYHVPVMK